MNNMFMTVHYYSKHGQKSFQTYSTDDLPDINILYIGTPWEDKAKYRAANLSYLTTVFYELKDEG